MVFEKLEKNPGARFLFILACLVIVVAGLRAGRPIMVPFALALFLAVVSMPVMFWLRRHRIGAPLAIFLTIGLNVLIFGSIIMIALSSVGDLSARLPRYNAIFNERFDGLGDWVRTAGLSMGLPVERIDELVNFDLLNIDLLSIDWSPLFGGFLDIVQAVTSIFSLAFLVGLITVFILAEATVFPYKFRAIFGSRRQGRPHLTKTIHEVQVYLGIKLLVSLATGLAAGLFCALMNLDFPVLLGIVAFVLNFVPTIGSIIAAIPAMALALVLYDLTWALFVGAGYFLMNMLFGNLIEPNLMGRRLGLSTLVIVLSLVFWFWVWGPVGALLSVPLTMVLKIALENTPDLRWAAVILDKVPPQARRKAQKEAAGEVMLPPVPIEADPGEPGGTESSGPGTSGTGASRATG